MMAIAFWNKFPHSSWPNILINQLTRWSPFYKQRSHWSCIWHSLRCQCLEGVVTPPKGQWWSQAALEIAAEAWKQARSQDSLLSSLMCFLKMVWLIQTSCFLLLKSWCDPLVRSAQRSGHNQQVRGMKDCTAESFMPWAGMCICSVHNGGRAIVLINQEGGLMDSLAPASLSVMPNAGGWPPLKPKGCEVLAKPWWGRALQAAQLSKGFDHSTDGEKRSILTKTAQGSSVFSTKRCCHVVTCHSWKVLSCWWSARSQPSPRVSHSPLWASTAAPNLH